MNKLVEPKFFLRVQTDFSRNLGHDDVVLYLDFGKLLFASLSKFLKPN